MRSTLNGSRAVLVWELRSTWEWGRGLPLMLGMTALLSVTTYLVAANQALNFLEQRESVSLTLQIAVAVGGLLSLLGAADAISGEREQGTWESVLLTPVPRTALLLGKALAALSLWLAAFALTTGYLLYLARGVGVARDTVLVGLVVGSLLAVFLVGLGIFASALAGSSRVSLAVTLFALLALYAPTQLPTSAQQAWFGELLLRVDPFTAGLHVINEVVVGGHPLGDQLPWLGGPVAAAGLAVVAASAATRWMGPDRSTS